MAKVYFVEEPAIGEFPATWGLWRVGTGPGRCEGTGFKKRTEARAWAKKWGHELVEKNEEEVTVKYRIEWRWNGNWRQDDEPVWLEKQAAIDQATKLYMDALAQRGGLDGATCKLTDTRVVREDGTIVWHSYEVKMVLGL